MKISSETIICCFLIALLLSCVSPGALQNSTDTSALPPVPREFRAAWVATVANINWPSKPGLPVNVQKEEALTLLNLLRSHHYNAVIFQVRPQCDALYASTLEPWSYYLTGKQGEAPNPFYDPLEFWIDEAHKRGLELHVWLNPYRAHHTAGGPVTDSSLVVKKPELAVSLKNGFWWLDPAKKATQDHSYQVVVDIVKRYDIDGVHFDDYFYPYPSYNDNEPFPDENTYLAYQNKGGKLSQGDWRRDQVNRFIKRVYRGIKKEKEYVKFGISPFGIWKPGHPASIQGFNQYEELYADAKLWLNKGWIDYFAPQLYWPVNQLPQSFPVLLNWWQKENSKNRHLWPGISIGRFKGEQAIDETINQIMISRAMLEDSPGTIHWSIGPLLSEDSLAHAILAAPYAESALIPTWPWLSRKTPLITDLKKNTSAYGGSLSIRSNKSFLLIILRYHHDGIWKCRVIPSLSGNLNMDLFSEWPDVKTFLVSIVDRYGVESKAVAITVP